MPDQAESLANVVGTVDAPVEVAQTTPWYKEITQPFVDLVHAPRALWGINLSYLIEGFVYFGMLGYLAMFFNEHVGLTDAQAGPMVGFLTWGITFSMFLFGGLSDKWGIRVSIVGALVLMLVGRIIIGSSTYIGLPTGIWSPTHFVGIAGLLLIIFGYGMYQPAAYAAVRVFTTPKTAGMGYAMLYALMNLGGWLPSFFAPIRKSVGINGAYVVYACITALGLILTALILSRKVVANAVADAKVKRDAERLAAGEAAIEEVAAAPVVKVPFNLLTWFKNHPLADKKFSFFIFALIPVQTLFAHNWLTLPMYVERAFKGTPVGDNFEFAVNANPLLIFFLVPVVTALTQKRKIFNMMILGTAVMAAPTFLLALGPSLWTLIAYILIMTVGEAMWQPRFLQYAAEIAPEGRTGAYMGVAQFPWFLTKVVTSLYSGWFLMNYCPAEGAQNTQTMWLWYGCIAMVSPVLLILTKGWLGKGFKERA
jgi:dipeptide/tripeptide permease